MYVLQREVLETWIKKKVSPSFLTSKTYGKVYNFLKQFFESGRKNNQFQRLLLQE